MAPDELRISASEPVAKPQTLKPAATPDSPQAEKPQSPIEQGKAESSNRLDPDMLEEIAEELNNDFKIFNTAVSFSVDDKTGTTVIKIFDRETDKVVREIPPEELLQIAARLTEVIGRIVDEKV